MTSLWDAVGRGVSTHFGNLTQQIIADKQRAKEDDRVNRGFEEASRIQSDPSLSPEDKQIKLYQALRNVPDTAKNLIANQLTARGQDMTAARAGQPSAANLAAQAKAQQKQADNESILRSLNPTAGQSGGAQVPQPGGVEQQPGLPGVPSPDQPQRPYDQKQIIETSLKNPTVGNLMQKQNDAFDALQIEKAKTARKESLEFHKESADYAKQIRESSKRATGQLEAVKDVREALATGKVKPASIANIFKGMGTLGDKLANAFKNPAQATLEANLPNLLEGWKEVFGVRLTNADLAILAEKMPDIGKTPEANEAVLKVIENAQKKSLLREEIANEIVSANGGLRPMGFENMVEAEFKKRTQSNTVTVIGPDGKRRAVPRDIADQVIQANPGARLA